MRAHMVFAKYAILPEMFAVCAKWRAHVIAFQNFSRAFLSDCHLVGAKWRSMSERPKGLSFGPISMQWTQLMQIFILFPG